MRRSLRILSSIVLTAWCMTASAQKNSEFDSATASIEENIQHPQIPEKHRTAVAAQMDVLKNELKDAGYEISLVRSGEVVMVTIPCSALFSPNETSLSAKASAKLSGLKQFINRREDFKIVIAVHSDDTGDAVYADRLTADRANSIDEYFYKEDSNRETGIIPYGIGSDEPLVDNHGRANRAKNRRVEFYFIPTHEFIKKARKR